MNDKSKKMATSNSCPTARDVLFSMDKHLEAIHMHVAREPNPNSPSDDIDSAGGILERFVSELTRALLLSASGERLDPTVRAVIRYYCETLEEVKRFERHKELPEDIRDDIVAGFSRVLTRYREDLASLHVTVNEVKPGTQLDVDWHRVEEQLSTDNPEALNTVAECMRPSFCWLDGWGKKCREPARVKIYGHLKKQEFRPDATQRKPRSELRRKRG